MLSPSSVAKEEGITGTNGHDGNNANPNADATELNTLASANATLGSCLTMADEELLTRLRSMNLSGIQAQVQPQNLQQQPEPNTQLQTRYSTSNSVPSVQPGAPNNSSIYAPATTSYMAANPYYFQTYHAYAPQQYALGAYAMNSTMVPVLTANYLSYDSAVATNTSTRTLASSSTNGTGPYVQQLPSQGGVPLYTFQNPMYYVQHYSVDDARNASNQGDSRGGNQFGTRQNYVSSYSSGAQLTHRNSALASAYYGSPNISFVLPYGNASVSSPIVPAMSMVSDTFSRRHPTVPVGVNRSIIGSTLMGQASITREELRVPSLLEELRNNTTRTFELADIAYHMVEFSCDQHGSRFIQQKLETASLEEKILVMNGVKPQSLALMKDVFGNYVIQKLFECGSFEQKVEVVQQIEGHVLPLSLHMYGCRVIQKVLEAVDAELQIRLISELDGHVIECVKDQNGNHVIQKCIECVSPRHISFILSAFCGQVVTLCTHPYGCRVIQRLWGLCTDEQKRGIMHEILPAVNSLAEDKYGNYVVQHILEYGEPGERSDIFMQMVGQLVQMSQHKFASNVIEKCFQFGGSKERQTLITEMLGDTDENEPLQAMMKDQYANYVVQKVLETCDGEQRELLLSRIRTHLHSLKKYTYGKHIVTRVEKLVAAGESHGATGG